MDDARKILNDKLQEVYNNKTNYEEKLIFIYKTLMQSQSYYLKYSGNEIFNENYLNFLLQKLKDIDNLDESKFKDFIEENIVNLMNSGHVKIVPLQEEYIVENIPAHLIKEEIEKEKIPNLTYSFNDNETLIITLRSFSRYYLEKDKEILKQLAEEIKKHNCEDIIIDIRGNQGGTDEYFEYFSFLFSENILSNENFRNLFTGKNESYSFLAIPKNDTGKDYNIRLLVDNKVFSTAQTFTTLLQKTGKVKIIGEPTLGEGFGLTPFTIVLNNELYNGAHSIDYKKITGIKLTFPIEAPVNNLGEIDYEHFYNTIPDIVCNSADSLDIALKDIENNFLIR